MVQEGELAIRLATDSLARIDTIAVEPEPVYGLILSPPEVSPQPEMRSDNSLDISFILCGLFLLFLVIALRFRNNFKYVITIFRNLVETRTRHNAFDDTVRETSMLVLLNVMWCASIGITGFCLYQYLFPELTDSNLRWAGMLWGMAFATVYTLVMWGLYSVVGWIFSDRQHAILWVKGFSASQALMTPAIFITALIGICTPDAGLFVGIAAAIVFIIGKLVFIWKGYRIFFNQISSWVLFLCYLCSLEIVPLILSYRFAVLLGEVL